MTHPMPISLTRADLQTSDGLGSPAFYVVLTAPASTAWQALI